LEVNKALAAPVDKKKITTSNCVRGGAGELFKKKRGGGRDGTWVGPVGSGCCCTVLLLLYRELIHQRKKTKYRLNTGKSKG